MNPQFNSFAEFYPFYLDQHQHPVCRGLHVVGLLAAISLATYALVSTHYWMLLLAPVLGYACSWTGHFVFENNRPATFGYPLYSFMGDFRMTWDSLRGRNSARALNRP